MTRDEDFLKKEVRKRIYLDLTAIVLTTIVFSLIIFLIPVYKNLNSSTIQFLIMLMVTVSYVMNALTLSYVRKL